MLGIAQNAAPKGDENVSKSMFANLPALINPVTGTTVGVPYNQQNIGQTIRPSATALLTIDSEDRFKTVFGRRNAVSTIGKLYNWNPYDFQIVKSEALMNGFITRLGVSEIVFPTAALPNINPKTDTINIIYNAGSGNQEVALKLTNGFYTPYVLASTMTSAVRSLATPLAAFTMVYGVGNIPCFQYKTNTTTTIAFFPNPGNIPAYPYSENTRQLYDVLGMTYSQNSQLTAAQTATSITNCQDSRYYDVICSQLTLNQSLKDASSQQIVRDSLCRIYIADTNAQNTVQCIDQAYTPPGTAPTTIYRNFTVPKQIQWIPNQSIPGNITIQVYDDNGNLLIPVVPGYGLDWSMTLLASEN